MTRRSILWDSIRPGDRLFRLTTYEELTYRILHPDSGSYRFVARLDQDLVHGDVLGLRERVDYRGGDVLGVEDARAGGLAVEFQRLVVGAQRGEVGGDVAGLDRRHLQPGARRLQPEPLRERLDEELARRVDRESWEHLPAGIRRDGNDVSLAPFEHPSKHRADAVEHPLAQHVDGPLPIVFKKVAHKSVIHDSRAVNEDVDRSEFFFGACYQRLDLPAVCYVCGHDQGSHPSPLSFEPCLQLEKRVSPTGRERHVGPLMCERAGNRSADAA